MDQFWIYSGELLDQFKISSGSILDQFWTVSMSSGRSKLILNPLNVPKRERVRNKKEKVKK